MILSQCMMGPSNCFVWSHVARQQSFAAYSAASSLLVLYLLLH